MSKDDPTYQLLLAQAERYMLSGQPKLAKHLKASGGFESEVDQRARQAKLVLEQCQARGLDPSGTQELVNEALMPGRGEE